MYLQHQLQKVMGNMMGFMAGNQSLSWVHFLGQVISKDRFNPQGCDYLGIDNNLRLLLFCILLHQRRRGRCLIQQCIVEEFVPGVLIDRLNVL